jgi:hypothetical protein
VAQGSCEAHTTCFIPALLPFFGIAREIAVCKHKYKAIKVWFVVSDVHFELVVVPIQVTLAFH